MRLATSFGHLQSCVPQSSDTMGMLCDSVLDQVELMHAHACCSLFSMSHSVPAYLSARLSTNLATLRTPPLLARSSFCCRSYSCGLTAATSCSISAPCRASDQAGLSSSGRPWL